MQLLDVSLRWLRVTRVDLCLLIYFVVYAVVWLNFHVNWLRTGSWEVEYLNGCLLATSGIAGLAYGLFRAWYFNPCMFLGYGDWLQTTPWTPRQPLPWGPLRLCWQDLLVLGIVAASLPWPLTIRLLAPLIPFSFSYCLLTWAVAVTHRETVFGYAFPVLLGFASLAIWSVPLYGSLIALLACLGVVSLAGLALAHYSHHHVLSRLASLELVSPIASLFERATGQYHVRNNAEPEAGWPAEVMLTETTERKWGAPHAIATGAVIAWLVIANLGPVEWIGAEDQVARDQGTVESPSDSTTNRGGSAATIANLPFIMLVSGMCLARLLYYCRNYHPPISLLGRLRTGRLIIPKYDQVWLPALVAMLCVIKLPDWLVAVGSPVSLAIALATGLAVAAVLGLPPSMHDWRYLGEHRIRHAQIRRTSLFGQATT